jgi:Trypsin-like peptidase domain
MRLNRRMSAAATVILAGLAVPAAALGLMVRASLSARGHARTAVPRSRTTAGVPEVGALYPNAAAARHMCTAGVVDSPGQNTLVTAAHCVSGSGAGMAFVPDEHDGRAPFGRWRVTAVHLAPAWVNRQDPHDDVAFLTVAPRRIHGKLTEIQRVTGGYRLGSTAVTGEPVTVTGYPAGARNDPITCTAKIYLTHGFPSFDCRGYVGGTSGSPWLHATAHGPEIVGVIGGLNDGGCIDSISSSPVIAGHAHAVYHRAATGVTGDIAPAPADDGCN